MASLSRPIRTWSEFRRRYPKFANASQVEIEGAISEAKNLVSCDAFLERYADAVEIKAACILESQMYGQESPPGKGKKTYQYQDAWDELCKLSPIRMMIL